MRAIASLCGAMLWLAGKLASAAPLYALSQEGASLAVIDPRQDRVLRQIAVDDKPAMMALSPDGARLYLTHPDLAQISVLDLSAPACGRVIARWRIDGEPFGVAADAQSVYVGDWSGDRLLRLSAMDGSVMASAATGRSPAGVALDAARGRVFVAARESARIDAFDIAAPDALRPLAPIAVGLSPFAIGVHGGDLLVANVKSNDFSVIDTQALRERARLAVGRMPYGVGLGGDGRRWLVANQQSGTLGEIDIESRRVMRERRVGRYPEGLAVDRDSGKVYVASWFDDAIAVLADDAPAPRRIAVAAGPRALLQAPVEPRGCDA